MLNQNSSPCSFALRTQQDVTSPCPMKSRASMPPSARGSCAPAAGATVDQPVEAALIRSDRRVAYPIATEFR